MFAYFSFQKNGMMSSHLEESGWTTHPAQQVANGIEP